MQKEVQIEANPEGGYLVLINGVVAGKVFKRNKTDWVARDIEDDHISTHHKSEEDAIHTLLEFHGADTPNL